MGGSTTLSYPPIWDQPYHITPPVALIPQEFTIASCFTAYCCRAAQVELDLEITAGSYKAKVNLLK